MSTASAPVLACNARLASAVVTGAAAPARAPESAPGKRCNKCCERAAVGRMAAVAGDDIGSDNARSGRQIGLEHRTATPKLIRPSQPLSIASASAAVKFRPLPAQITGRRDWAAMRASNANPTTTIIG